MYYDGYEAYNHRSWSVLVLCWLCSVRLLGSNLLLLVTVMSFAFLFLQIFMIKLALFLLLMTVMPFWDILPPSSLECQITGALFTYLLVTVMTGTFFFFDWRVYCQILVLVLHLILRLQKRARSCCRGHWEGSNMYGSRAMQSCWMATPSHPSQTSASCAR